MTFKSCYNFFYCKKLCDMNIEYQIECIFLSQYWIWINSTSKCIAIAPPPVFRSGYLHSNFTKNIKIFINENDLVPRLSLHNVARLKAVVETIDSKRSSIFQMIRIVIWNKAPDQKYINIGRISLLKKFFLIHTKVSLTQLS